MEKRDRHGLGWAGLWILFWLIAGIVIAATNPESLDPGEQPDLIIATRLAHLGLLDFHRAKEAIEEGRRAVERVAHSLPVGDDPKC